MSIYSICGPLTVDTVDSVDPGLEIEGRDGGSREKKEKKILEQKIIFIIFQIVVSVRMRSVEQYRGRPSDPILLQTNHSSMHC